MNEAAVPIEERLRAAGLPALPRLTWLEVDLGQLRANAAILRAVVGDLTALAVVTKADGYGHGLVAASHAGLAGGAGMLAVATLDEALLLRGAGFTARILVLYAVPAAALGDALDAGLDLVAMDRQSAQDIGAALRARPRQVRSLPGVRGGLGISAADAATAWQSDVPVGPRIHLGLDTGMTRGGFAPGEAVAAARLLLDAGLPALAGTWSHLASPEDPEATRLQVEAFEGGLRALAAAGIDPGLRHLNATGGIVAGAPPWDMARAGLAFYGHLPGEVRAADGRGDLGARLRPAIRLLARASSIETVPTGTSVGYGGTWTSQRTSTIATVALGYADGWTRLYSPGSTGSVRGRSVPLVGRVGSDAIAADVSDVPGFDHGDELVLVGAYTGGAGSVEDLAGRRGSIPWEVLDAFTPRLSRVYVEDGRPVAVRYLDGNVIVGRGFRLRTAPHAARSAGADAER